MLRDEMRLSFWSELKIDSDETLYTNHLLGSGPFVTLAERLACAMLKQGGDAASEFEDREVLGLAPRGMRSATSWKIAGQRHRDRNFSPWRHMLTVRQGGQSDV